MDEAIKPPQIMVVDDDQDTVAILARHLQREGFVAIEANSGAQCLKLVHENEVDVILLDLMMPDMDGFAVVKGEIPDRHNGVLISNDSSALLDFPVISSLRAFTRFISVAIGPSNRTPNSPARPLRWAA